MLSDSPRYSPEVTLLSAIVPPRWITAIPSVIKTFLCFIRSLAGSVSFVRIPHRLVPKSFSDSILFVMDNNTCSRVYCKTPAHTDDPVISRNQRELLSYCNRCVLAKIYWPYDLKRLLERHSKFISLFSISIHIIKL